MIVRSQADLAPSFSFAIFVFNISIAGPRLMESSLAPPPPPTNSMEVGGGPPIYHSGVGNCVDALATSSEVPGLLLVGTSKLGGSQWGGEVQIVDIQHSMPMRVAAASTDSGVSAVAWCAGGMAVGARDDGCVDLLAVADAPGAQQGNQGTELPSSLELRARFAEHHDIATAVAQQPGVASHLASASWDGSVKLWDTGRATSLRTLHAHSSHVLGLCWCGTVPSTAPLLATASRDATVCCWDIRVGGDSNGCVASLAVEHAATTVSWSRHSAAELVAGLEDGTVLVFDLRFTATHSINRAHEIRRLPVCATAGVHHMSHDPCTPGVVACACDDGAVRLTQVRDCGMVAGQPPMPPSPTSFPESRGGAGCREAKTHADYVRALAWGESTDSSAQWLASGSWDQTVSLHQIRSGTFAAAH